MTSPNPLQKKIILASASPRRQSLIKDLGIDYKIIERSVEEHYPAHLKGAEIAIYLSKLKASAFSLNEIPENHILITADTIVCLDDQILSKPKDFDHARQILTQLSDRTHEVITGVCLRSNKKEVFFSASTRVTFKVLSDKEINYYIEKFQPYDKAGAYGIQEWIGYIAIKKIKGSFYNVMGLPVQRLYDELLRF
ncbi:MAG: septum formation protein Maf [Bacteroidetes bacterium]|nr:septum formation protein Maf [Bacteroidota bacterium]